MTFRTLNQGLDPLRFAGQAGDIIRWNSNGVWGPVLVYSSSGIVLVILRTPPPPPPSIPPYMVPRRRVAGPPPPWYAPPPSPKPRLSFQQTVIRHRNCPPKLGLTSWPTGGSGSTWNHKTGNHRGGVGKDNPQHREPQGPFPFPSSSTHRR